MKDYALLSLQDYYDKRYSRPKDDKTALTVISGVYKHEMPDWNSKTEESIGLIYRELLAKGLPAYYWMLESIHRTAKKVKGKQHFGYIVSMLRNWSVYGFGNSETEHETELNDYFEEVTGVNMSVEARKVITQLMGVYGLFKIMRSLPKLSEIDLSLFYAELLAKHMTEKFELKIQDEMKKEFPHLIEATSSPYVHIQESFIEASPTQEVIEFNLTDKNTKESGTTTPKNKAKQSSYSGAKSDKIVELIIKCLQEKGPSSPLDMVDYINSKTIKKFNVTKKTISFYLASSMEREPRVHKRSRGVYAFNHSPNEE